MNEWVSKYWTKPMGKLCWYLFVNIFPVDYLLVFKTQFLIMYMFFNKIFSCQWWYQKKIYDDVSQTQEVVLLKQCDRKLLGYFPNTISHSTKSYFVHLESVLKLSKKMHILRCPGHRRRPPGSEPFPALEHLY